MAVVGNGLTLGLTNGTNLVGLTSGTNGDSANTFNPFTNAYGQPVTNSATNHSAVGGWFGITTDPNYSGVIADLSSTTTCNMIIKY